MSSKYNRTSITIVCLFCLIIYIFLTKLLRIILLHRGFCFVFNDSGIDQYYINDSKERSLPHHQDVPDTYDSFVVPYLLDLQNIYYEFLATSSTHLLSMRSCTTLKYMLYTKTSHQPAALIMYEADSHATIILIRGTNGNTERGLDFDVNGSPQHSVMSHLHTREYTSDQTVLVHTGFQSHYYSIRAQLLDAIGELGADKVYIFGHSLGGAIANLLVYDLLDGGIYLSKKVYAVTVGAPRVGNPEFCNRLRMLDARIIRIHNSADIVCSVPLSSMPVLDIWGLAMRRVYTYQHAGMGYMFNLIGKNLLDSHSLPTYKRAIDTKRLVSVDEY